MVPEITPLVRPMDSPGGKRDALKVRPAFPRSLAVICKLLTVSPPTLSWSPGESTLT